MLNFFFSYSPTLLISMNDDRYLTHSHVHGVVPVSYVWKSIRLTSVWKWFLASRSCLCFIIYYLSGRSCPWCLLISLHFSFTMKNLCTSTNFVDLFSVISIFLFYLCQTYQPLNLDSDTQIEIGKKKNKKSTNIFFMSWATF